MKNTFLKRAHFFFTSLFIVSIHLPFVFANTKQAEVIAVSSPRFVSLSGTVAAISNKTASVFEMLELGSAGLSEEAFNAAMKGYEYLREKGKLQKQDIISIIDFTRSSAKKRLFVIDLKNCKTLFCTYVSHGQGSGEEYATKFSNIPESYQSSLGFYITEGTYSGKNGYSLHLDGQEKGINDNAEERAIVIHGAPYVSETYIRDHGYIGRSWGCPAVPEKLNKPIIEKIKNGSCVFIYGNNRKYLSRSKILNS
ncbi:MAG: murein L,D-transpeptidase catalytic domain family protein [Bacteroidetes bacterium]|nr:murein L,D-transpeptidase catalytic domain family protein [Bacteroidota bacterium]